MKVLIWFGPSFVCRVLGSLRFTGHYETNGMRSVATNGKRRVTDMEAGWEGSFIAFATRALHAPPTSHKKSEETE